MSEVVSIVSGGWSASQVDLNAVPGFVIGVNNSSLHMPRIDAGISMDRRWAEAYWPWFKTKNETQRLELYLRPNNVLNIIERPDWLHVYKCDHRSHVMSDEPGKLNGTNSGGVALNLAYQMRPKTLYLFGFDYRPGPKSEWHWFEHGVGKDVVGAYSIQAGRYGGWARQFDAAGPMFKSKGIDVVNVSDISVVRAFRKLSPRDFMKGVR